jgi:hypothetical protein
MADNEKIQTANQESNLSNGLKFWSGNVENWGAFATVLMFGILQEPIIQNLQLLIYLPNQFPSLKMGHWIFGIAASFIASIFLLFQARSFKTKAWWFSFICMAIPYLYLKYLGVYFDSTNYMIATAEGRRIGGGAAFGHILLMFYILGAAQLVSWITFSFLETKRRLGLLVILSNTKNYLKIIFGINKD